MLDLQLIYKRGGTLQTESNFDLRLAEARFRDGERLRAKVGRRRSVRENNFFHALCEKAWDNQSKGSQLATWRHLKAKLLIDVGHCTEHRVWVGNLTMREAAAAGVAIATAVRLEVGDYVGVGYDRTDGTYVFRTAKSVSFDKTDGEEMKVVVDKVVAIICTEIVPGMDPEALLSMAKSKAA